MTAPTDMKTTIAEKITAFASGNLYNNALNLLNVLGYRSDKTEKLHPNTTENFLNTYDLQNIFNRERALIDNWQSVDFIFQLTEDEMSVQNDLFKTNMFNIKEYQSYLFFAIELKIENYSRGKYVSITREINKLFPMPVLIIFKVGDNLTFSIINRRPNKREQSRDVLEKITLIKDINIQKPHRAHIEILYDLSYIQLRLIHTISNFLELHDAWQKTLDSSELNKKFFKEIADWYFWAVKKVEFPADCEPKKDVRNAISVIRLITRLIFVWFLKEKNLVPEKLFNKSDIDNILNKIDKTGSTYYKAILQNLFLATLNTEMNKDKPGSRKFVERSDYKNHSQQHLMPAYRYERFFKNPFEAQQLFENIPFLNGGLFENLDYEISENEGRRIIRIDCFSDKPKNETLLKVPDELFFGSEKQVDLSEDYGDKKRNKETVRGIIPTLNKYKFTVEENTPIEEEIALDPELLGKVFENLLASYNPETHTTARKQTGSFYTPREIVNFMVDESLIAYLENSLVEFYENQKSFGAVTPPSQSDIFGKTKPQQMKMADKKIKLTEEQKAEIKRKLYQLISYNDLPHSFNDQEVDVLIKAIDKVKILDPACGSGAFPMGILQKLVYVLNKLDPHNERWKDEQVTKVQKMIHTASEIHDTDRRQEIITDLEKQIASIEDAFANNELDYGRKLYLIENCIYGVDIQPIAVQIAKLRFFISLVIDQRVDPEKKNLNIRPLPNLETKFVAANTLIGLDKPEQTKLRNLEIEKLEMELKNLRQKHFNARTRSEKVKYRKKDEKLRNQIAELLIDDGWNDKSAHQIADWDPYNQNSSSDFFDPEWMFGLDKGFDVVIGNPPYVRQERLGKNYKDILKKCHLEVANGIADLYVYFFSSALKISKKKSIVTFITLNKWLKTKYGKNLRNELKNYHVKFIIDFFELPIFQAATDTAITLIKNEKLPIEIKYFPVKTLDNINLNELIKGSFKKVKSDGYEWQFIDNEHENILTKIYDNAISLKEFTNDKIEYGIKTGLNKAFIIDNETKNLICRSDPNSTKIIKPYIRSTSIKKYYTKWGNEWIIFTRRGIDINKYIGVKKYLKKFRTKLEPKPKDWQEKWDGRKPGSYQWYEIQDNIAYYKEFEKHKIIYIHTAKNHEFYLDTEGYFINNSCYMIISNDKFLFFFLNSKLFDWFKRIKFVAYGDASEDGRVKLDYNKMITVPIKKINESIHKLFETKYESIKQLNHERDSNEICKLEQEVNLILYKLYKLDYSEVKIVDTQLEMSEQEYNNLHFDFEILE